MLRKPCRKTAEVFAVLTVLHLRAFRAEVSPGEVSGELRGAGGRPRRSLCTLLPGNLGPRRGIALERMELLERMEPWMINEEAKPQGQGEQRPNREAISIAQVATDFRPT